MANDPNEKYKNQLGTDELINSVVGFTRADVGMAIEEEGYEASETNIDAVRIDPDFLADTMTEAGLWLIHDTVRRALSVTKGA